MADNKGTIKQAVVVQLASLAVFAGMVFLDTARNGELNFSIFLYISLLSIAIGVSPDSWVEIIERIFGRKK